MIRHDEIRKKRRTLDITQTKAAKGCGISQAYFAEIERGKAVPSIKTLFSISKFLNLDIKNILEVS